MNEEWLTPFECGRRIGVSADFICGEIRDGRLLARRKTYRSGRSRLRVAASEFDRYVAEVWRPTTPQSTA